jgi:hypothetical protein
VRSARKGPIAGQTQDPPAPSVPRVGGMPLQGHTGGRRRRKEGREKGGSIWGRSRIERRKTRGGPACEVMQCRRARASSAAPVSRRRCVGFPLRKQRHAVNHQPCHHDNTWFPFTHLDTPQWSFSEQERHSYAPRSQPVSNSSRRGGIEQRQE